jgi:bifunctional non-homologous end joining protein LigD
LHSMAKKGAKPKQDETWTIAGQDVEVTSLDRVLWPDDGLTKLNLLCYCWDMSPIMLRYIEDHPVSLRVFPRGIDASGYYRRRLPDNAPDWIAAIDYQAGSRSDVSRTPVIRTAADLVWFANQGTIEFHMWSAKQDDIEHPVWAVFDLDPGDRADFDTVRRAALVVRELVVADDLEPFVKTSGARGMHVFVPIEPVHKMSDVREWVRGIAQRAADEYPDLIQPGAGETHRGRKVTVDDAQNSVARNTAAPYTLRALQKAPVSTPLTWEEVEAGGFAPDGFTIQTLPKRLDEVGDLWETAEKTRRRLKT